MGAVTLAAVVLTENVDQVAPVAVAVGSALWICLVADRDEPPSA